MATGQDEQDPKLAFREYFDRESQYSRREAMCTHQMIAGIYQHCARWDYRMQILSHDVDLDGVDLTLGHNLTFIPLQLKARWHDQGGSAWSVRRRLLFPLDGTVVHDNIIRNPGVDTEGAGGALVAQYVVPLPRFPWMKLWYRMTNIPLIYLRDRNRFEEILKECRDCPQSIKLKASDLTPPLEIGEVLWLLFGLPPFSELRPGGGTGSPLSYLDAFPAHAPHLAEFNKLLRLGRERLVEFEAEAKKRYRRWVRKHAA